MTAVSASSSPRTTSAGCMSRILLGLSLAGNAILWYLLVRSVRKGRDLEQINDELVREQLEIAEGIGE